MFLVQKYKYPKSAPIKNLVMNPVNSKCTKANMSADKITERCKFLNPLRNKFCNTPLNTNSSPIAGIIANQIIPNRTVLKSVDESKNS